MDNPIHVVTITDSSANIYIVEGFKNSFGMKTYLQPEAEVAMEVWGIRSIQNNDTYKTNKMKSYIE